MKKGNKKRSEVSEIVITIFLGIFGIHRLLKGSTKSGLIFLFTLGLFGIGWLVDVYCVLFLGSKIRFMNF